MGTAKGIFLFHITGSRYLSGGGDKRLEKSRAVVSSTSPEPAITKNCRVKIFKYKYKILINCSVVEIDGLNSVLGFSVLISHVL